MSSGGVILRFGLALPVMGSQQVTAAPQGEKRQRDVDIVDTRSPKKAKTAEEAARDEDLWGQEDEEEEEEEDDGGFGAAMEQALEDAAAEESRRGKGRATEVAPAEKASRTPEEEEMEAADIHQFNDAYRRHVDEKRAWRAALAARKRSPGSSPASPIDLDGAVLPPLGPKPVAPIFEKRSTWDPSCSRLPAAPVKVRVRGGKKVSKGDQKRAEWGLTGARGDELAAKQQQSLDEAKVRLEASRAASRASSGSSSRASSSEDQLSPPEQHSSVPSSVSSTGRSGSSWGQPIVLDADEEDTAAADSTPITSEDDEEEVVVDDGDKAAEMLFVDDLCRQLGI